MPLQDSRPPKRIKLDNPDYAIFDESSQRRKLTDLCSSGPGSLGLGYLTGTIFMVWKPTEDMQLRAVVQTRETNVYGSTTTVKFYVVFTGSCAQFFNYFSLRVQDEVFLSLKGARLEKTNKDNVTSLGLKLVYREGAIIMLRNNIEAPRIVDTWKLSNDWFASQPPPALPKGKTRASEKDDRRKHRSARQAKKKETCEIARRITKGHQAQLPQSTQQSSISTTTVVIDEPPSESTVNIAKPEEPMSFCPIGKVSANRQVNLIGIVIQISPPSRTRTNELCINFKIADQSSRKRASGDLDGLGVNCFTKEHLEWLPQPSVGDVLILKNVMIRDVHGFLKGTGYSNQLQWAIFNPRTRKVSQGMLGNATRSVNLSGRDLSPFFDPGPNETQRCMQLADWWQGADTGQANMKPEVHQIKVKTITRSSGVQSGPERRHRLIRDAGPHVEPSGYFDCTIEVLHGSMNHNDVYSLYVTDYTKNDQLNLIQAQWCSSELARCVLRIEMWDQAATVGPTMECGSYYSISNVRMKVGRTGDVEGKLVQGRGIHKLIERDADQNPNLKALLERKKAWNIKGEVEGTSTAQNKLIEDAVENEFFNCVVEVLHIAVAEYDAPAIYVTDYTQHVYLEAYRFSEKWSKGLEGRVMKISLWDEHRRLASSITPGFYFAINKLHLKLSTSGGRFEGELRGRERLINQLNPEKPSEELKQLLLRKEAFLQTSRCSPSPEPLKVMETEQLNERAKSPTSLSDAHGSSLEHESSSTDSDIDSMEEMKLSGASREATQIEVVIPELPEMAELLPERDYFTLKEMMDSESCPDKFLVCARIISYSPLQLTDCSMAFCMRCDAKIPTIYQACVDCMDSDHEYVAYKYQLVLKLEDEEGTTLEVSVFDKSPFLNGLERANFKTNKAAFNGFCACLAPLLGDFVQDGGTEIIKSTVQTGLKRLVIISWPEQNKRVYGLYKAENEA
ncbi:hypothetical protein AMATHDRAFT_83294 [Amanita thiersii Skay4041]|uniref:Protection of telomeres protein 1 n=1 Tax=Amanita thiersii Skay4041 TaxID=703135 RepID=A0A2A9NZW0_9AGAR|nr:hypothetical protein AMATHDRAFT_83294 [Amanita thiersii Skay4041]